MTEAELAAIEKTWGKVHSCDCSVCPFDSRDAAALIAEVRRLRAVVEEVARYEACIGDDFDQPIQNLARKALAS